MERKCRYGGWSIRMAGLASVILGCTGALLLNAAEPLPESDAREIGVDAYIFGYPLVTMEMTRRVMTNTEKPEGNHAPMGQFYQSRTYPNASFRDVTAPNADTLYSTAWLDLSREPYILSIPDEKGRYFLMPMLSGWTDVFAVPGTRTTGTGAQKYAITGPGWKGTLPPDVKEHKSPTNLTWIIGRTYSSGTPEDFKEVHAIQEQYTLVPLSAYGKPYTPPPGKVDPGIDMKTPVRDQVNRMDANSFFQMLAALMKDNPPTEADTAMVEKMARIGISPGKPFAPGQLDPAVAKALEGVPKIALAKIQAHEKDAGKQVNGWTFSLKTGAYGTDYLQRAFITLVGLGANHPEDAVYPITKVDAQGKPLNGSNRYVIHFEKGQTPPVKGFWSLTMYDPSFFFVENPLNRYTLSSRSPFKYNTDGSLDLYIQNETPGPEKESNWLPAPAGGFVLMLRMYWPEAAVLKGTWQPPAVEPVNGRMTTAE